MGSWGTFLPMTLSMISASQPPTRHPETSLPPPTPCTTWLFPAGVWPLFLFFQSLLGYGGNRGGNTILSSEDYNAKTTPPTPLLLSVVPGWSQRGARSAVFLKTQKSRSSLGDMERWSQLPDPTFSTSLSKGTVSSAGVPQPPVFPSRPPSSPDSSASGSRLGWSWLGWWVKSREAGTSPELCLQHRGKGPHRQPPWDRILQIHQPWTWGLHGSGHSLGPQAAHQSSWWWLAVGEKPGAPRQSSSWLRSGLSRVAREVAWQGTWWLSGHSCAARGPKPQATLSPAVAVDARVTGVL